MNKTAVISAVLIVLAGGVACRRNAPLIRAPGSVEGKVVTVRSPAAGTLDAWRAAEGDRLERGQELGRLNGDKLLNALEEVALAEDELANQEARLGKKLASLRANVDYLRRQVGRLERLKEDAAVAGDQLEKTSLQLLDAETGAFEAEKSLAALGIQREKLAVRRRALDLQLKDTIFLSPVAGPVLETFVTAGEMLLPGAALADILDEGSLYVGVFLEEREVGRLRMGGRAEILVDGRTGTPLPGTVSFFGRRAEFSPKYILSEKERQALLYEVRVAPEDPDGVLKTGMPVTVVFRPE